METRSNHLWVGSIVLLLIAAIIGLSFWFARINDQQDREFDIFFKQSVNGLAKGSSVTYAGVPSGQVKDISLWQKDPSFVKVRIVVDKTAPVLQGTTATIQGVGFTGVSEVQLDGAVKGAPPISCPDTNPEASCPDGVPVIPTRPGALGELLNNAPQLLARLTTLTERLTQTLDDDNQRNIAGILANTNRLTGSLANQGPEIAATIGDTRIALQRASVAAEDISRLVATTNGLLAEDGKPLVADLRRAVAAADRSMKTLDETLQAARPGIQTFSGQTLPEISQLVSDLRDTSTALRSVTEKLDQQGAASLLGSPKLPDYEP